MRALSVGLSWLPEDILLHLLISLEVTSLLKVRQTCKRIYSCSKAKQLWVCLYLDEVVRKHRYFAPYWKHIDDLDDTLLEGLILHILRLEWRISMRHTPLIVPLHQKRSVTWVRLIRSHWLLVASSDDISSVIALWSVSELLSHSNSTTPSAPLAEAFLPAPVVNGAVDIQETSIRFALELHGSIDQIDVLSVVEIDGRLHICRLRTIEHVRNLRCLQGYYIGASLFQNTNVPCVVGWTSNFARALQLHPDEQGGAIAMHMGIGWIAVVRRCVFEIYTLHKGHSALWRRVELPHLVGSATFSRAEIYESSLRVCITTAWGLFVYGLECIVEEDLFTLNLLWQYDPPPEDELNPIASRGTLGVTGNSVSWIHGDNYQPSRPVSVATIRVTDCNMGKSTLSQWSDRDIPALYFLGVFDFDEARGVLVMGNAFGELSILDFSGSDPHHFAKCLVHPIEPTSYRTQELLPTCEIRSCPGAPFPYFCTSEQVRSNTWKYWKSRRPAVIPEGWSADFEQNEDYMGWFATYSGIIFSCHLLAWQLENAGHFYGRPVPLLYRTCEDNRVEWVICVAGGLFFVWNPDWSDELMLARPGIALEQLASEIDSGNPPVDIIEYDLTEDIIATRFHCSFDEELKQHGRNRCTELRERGGRVGEGWTDYREVPCPYEGR